MKQLLLIIAIAATVSLNAQRLLTTSPSGGNKKASVSERIGITDITIHYDRPGVKGREGKIWGQLIPAGYTDQQFGSSKAAPWRAGANECTTFECSTDVTIEGHTLPAGKYGFFVVYTPDNCTLIFSSNTSNWGSFYYDPKEDVLQVKIRPVVLDKSVEWLKYEFTNQTENSAVINLMWEKLSIPFKVEVDINKTQIASFRNELRTDRGFFWLPWQMAAQWCVDHNTNLEEALLWADTATNPNILGNLNFQTLSTKAQVLTKLGRTSDADDVMKTAFPLATMGEVHAYGRQLLVQKRSKEAYTVFKMNYDKYPDVFTTNMGMVRACSGIGDHKQALSFAEKALLQAPDNANKQNIEKLIGLLKQGRDIN